uniref:Uncharacterized protein n=1 Tax=Arundo donax TaxID=35708 RepID=A0A0A9EPN0_ARUDO
MQQKITSNSNNELVLLHATTFKADNFLVSI